ncbi:hypothetical protein ACOSP7_011864 [Xanthoceras sorbifolium]|uniref:Uncharacterized protein n=1 Tax=Xanthoceras sorbifolium TaxID=99658 RepID=A0ABQ8HWR2_9ROSI|nr:hypothetical protein JRO89_XS06G0053700 [Xanthoceras sorbifolium]
MMHRRRQKNAEESKQQEKEEQKRVEGDKKVEFVKQKSKGVWATNPKPNEATAVWVECGNCEKAYWVQFTPPPWASLPPTPITPTGWECHAFPN